VKIGEKIVVPIITCILGALVTGVVTYSVNLKTQKAIIQKAELDRRKAEQDRRKAFYQQLKIHLDGSFAAFQNQAIARNRLVDLLNQRYGTLPNLEYDELFRKYHKNFNEEEKLLCNLMRGITTESLYKHDQGMVNLLEKNPEFREELADFKALQGHLDLWLSKYKVTAKENRDDWCLVYVGVQENRPFPPQIDANVARILSDFPKSSE
jgi:hypothetical protein